MAQVTLLSRIALGASAALIIGTAAGAQPPPTAPAPPPQAPPASAPAAPAPAATAPAPAAAAPQFPPTATIANGYPGVGPADSSLRVAALPNGKKLHLLPATR